MSQLKLLQELQELGYNIATCGRCGSVLIHETGLQLIKCPDCAFTSESCDFPDLFY